MDHVIYIIKIKMLSNTAFLLAIENEQLNMVSGLRHWNVNVPDVYLILKLIGYASKGPSTYRSMFSRVLIVYRTWVWSC